MRSRCPPAASWTLAVGAGRAEAGACWALPALERNRSGSICVARYPSDAVADHWTYPPESWDHPRGALPPNRSRDTVYYQVVRMLTRISLCGPPPTSKLTQRHPRRPGVLRQRTYVRYPRCTTRPSQGGRHPAARDGFPEPLRRPSQCRSRRLSPAAIRVHRSGARQTRPPQSRTPATHPGPTSLRSVSGRRRKSCEHRNRGLKSFSERTWSPKKSAVRSPLIRAHGKSRPLTRHGHQTQGNSGRRSGSAAYPMLGMTPGAPGHMTNGRT